MPYLKKDPPKVPHVCTTPYKEHRAYAPHGMWSGQGERPYSSSIVPDGEVGYLWMCDECGGIWRFTYKKRWKKINALIAYFIKRKYMMIWSGDFNG